MGKNYTPPVERQMGGQQDKHRQVLVRPPELRVRHLQQQVRHLQAAAQPASTAPRIGSLPPEFDKFIAACRGGSKDTPGSSSQLKLFPR